MRLNTVLPLVIAALSLSCKGATAESIVFESTFSVGQNQVYTYGFLESPFQVVQFGYGDTITLTGLSDVVGVQTGPSANCFTGSYTASSVTLTQTQFQGGCSLGNFTASPLEVSSFLFVLSTETSEGAVAYAINGDPGAIGSTTGPVTAASAATPEPASMVLLATGFAALAGLGRRRQNATAPAA